MSAVRMFVIFMQSHAPPKMMNICDNHNTCMKQPGQNVGNKNFDSQRTSMHVTVS